MMPIMVKVMVGKGRRTTRATMMPKFTESKRMIKLTYIMMSSSQITNRFHTEENNQCILLIIEGFLIPVVIAFLWLSQNCNHTSILEWTRRVSST